MIIADTMFTSSFPVFFHIYIYFKNICKYIIDLFFPLHISCAFSKSMNIFLSRTLKGNINPTGIRARNGFN